MTSRKRPRAVGDFTTGCETRKIHAAAGGVKRIVADSGPKSNGGNSLGVYRTDRMSKPSIHPNPADFSLVLGGPLFQLFRRAHLSGSALELLHRRIVLIVALAWLPLLILAIPGYWHEGVHRGSFFSDLDVHARFLLALPVVIAAELIVHKSLRPIVDRFVERKIIGPEDEPKLHRITQSVLRVRNSVVVEIVLLAAVYSIGCWLWRENHFATQSDTWYAQKNGEEVSLTPPGVWYAYVSNPIFQFLIARWYFRIALWLWFLWQVSRLDLRLMPAHHDRAGGLGFLGDSVGAFAPILFAQGAILAGFIANRIFHDGKSLIDYKIDIACLIGMMVLFVLFPLMVFSDRMGAAKNRSRDDYARLATHGVREFDGKWITPVLEREQSRPTLGEVRGAAAAVEAMRIIPFDKRAVVNLIVITAAPISPLILTVIPLEEVIARLIKIIF